ncbi:hypothetical protein U1E44_14400 [Arenibacter sp. GZD96]|uniref:hypothetical protein n=1 Tax=Aurantibrevibacter litoralis TaxID=3106030 RepID=UPI002AFE9561|nr:hypothetical protein [Arenibacter sp. GZD-96]MEA1787289.1 hypothetical protein [Arenibacter sp. GZD-96]
MKEKSKVISLFDKKMNFRNEIENYSDLLNDFIAPFQNDFPEAYELHDVVQFAIYAWNFANMKNELPAAEFEKVRHPPLMPDEENAILQKMLALKGSKFAKYSNYILDYALEEVEEGEEDMKLTLQTAGFEEFMIHLQSETADSHTQEDYEENYINRYAVIVKPRQPFFDWLNALYPDDKIDEIDEANVYLVDDAIGDLEKWLQKKFDKFFTMELYEWHTRKKDWPQKRNFKMFKQWFQVDVASMVYDMEKIPVSKALF